MRGTVFFLPIKQNLLNLQTQMDIYVIQLVYESIHLASPDFLKEIVSNFTSSLLNTSFYYLAGELPKGDVSAP
jgi:hypothetical protein